MRAKKAAYNSLAQLLYMAVTVVSGLIIPRLILSNFGSDYYGVTASISQFIEYISLLSAGVGGVTMAALYKPLAECDIVKVSGIIRATEIFMRKVALTFAVILVGIAICYPLLVRDEFGWLFTFTLALIIGIGTFAQYFFGITYQLLLIADQRGYVISLIKIFATLLNVVIAALLILGGNEIRVVKLASALVFIIIPIFTYFYVKKRYSLVRGVAPDKIALKQRWDAFAHQLANFIQSNIGIILLTVFVGIMDVSVYAVYNLILINIRRIIDALMGSGIVAAFGNMLVKNEDNNVQKNFRLYEFMSNSLSVLLYACTAMLIVSFISVYTKGVVDVDYYRPLFAYLACVTQLFMVFRVPYEALVNAAGHFKQTRNVAIIEVGINIVLSVVLVQRFGLVGVIVGSLCAIVYRTIMYAVYTSKHLLQRSLWEFARKLLLALVNAGLIVLLAQFIPQMNELTYVAWILQALPVFGVSAGVTILFAVVFYRNEMRLLFKTLHSVMSKK